MAKEKPDMTNIFAKTEPDGPHESPLPEKIEKEDPVKAIGIGLKESEWEKMGEIADDLLMTRHALAMYALRDFMSRYDTGEIKTQTKPSLPPLGTR
jgi:hypothetical protein